MSEQSNARASRRRGEEEGGSLSVEQIVAMLEQNRAALADDGANSPLAEPDVRREMDPPLARDEPERTILQAMRAVEARLQAALAEAERAPDEPNRRRADQRAAAYSRELRQWLARWTQHQRVRERAAEARSDGPPLPGDSPSPLWCASPLRRRLLESGADDGVEGRVRYAVPAEQTLSAGAASASGADAGAPAGAAGGTRTVPSERRGPQRPGNRQGRRGRASTHAQPTAKAA